MIKQFLFCCMFLMFGTLSMHAQTTEAQMSFILLEKLSTHNEALGTITKELDDSIQNVNDTLFVSCLLILSQSKNVESADLSEPFQIFQKDMTKLLKQAQKEIRKQKIRFRFEGIRINPKFINRLLQTIEKDFQTRDWTPAMEGIKNQFSQWLLEKECDCQKEKTKPKRL